MLPKPVLAKLHLRPGDALVLESSEGSVILRPARRKARIYQKQGVWVFNSGVPMDADVVRKTIFKVRNERDRHNLGKLR